ncbi:MAG: hypothetical protein KDH98_05995 [Calditrichaeota bacterium]|nr:hypothetical protein [Calditrichota bacterium]
MNEKLRKVYFLFSKLKAEKKGEPILELILDCFLSNDNQHLLLSDLTRMINQLGITKEPENISKVVTEKPFKGYFEVSPQNDGNDLVRLNKIVFRTFKSYTDYNEKLYKYVDDYLDKNSLESSSREKIIDILLESIFQQNLNVLRQLISIKDQSLIENLFATSTITEYEDNDLKVYNDFIIKSDEEFNEILKVLLLKVFDFLKFHYNPDVDKSLNKMFKNKEFYLDSSFVIRLLGFHGDYRANRAEALLDILTRRDSIKFVIHRKTLNEIEGTVYKLVKQLERLLQRSDAHIRKLIETQNGKNNEILELYLKLKDNGEVTEYEDFYLYFKKPYYQLIKYFKKNQLRLDDTNIDKENDDQKELEGLLRKTVKSSNRIDHISKLVAFLKNERGQNNYNFFDIKYWLLTTDRKTLNVDSKLVRKHKYKSVCIMPTELLRMLGTSTDISTDIIDVFKKFMLRTRTLNKTDYTEQQVDFIDKILVLAESAAEKTSYPVDFIFEMFFEDNSLNELENRLKPIERSEDRDKELVNMFSNTINHALKTDLLKKDTNQKEMAELLSLQIREKEKIESYRDWYDNFIDNFEKEQRDFFSNLHLAIVWFIPIALLVYLLWSFKSESIIWSDPQSYFNLVKANQNQLWFWILEVIGFGMAKFLRKATKNSFVNYFVAKKLKAVSMKAPN